MPIWPRHSDRGAVKVSLALFQECIPVLCCILAVRQTEQPTSACCRQPASKQGPRCISSIVSTSDDHEPRAASRGSAMLTQCEDSNIVC